MISKLSASAITLCGLWLSMCTFFLVWHIASAEKRLTHLSRQLKVQHEQLVKYSISSAEICKKIDENHRLILENRSRLVSVQQTIARNAGVRVYGSLP